MSNSYEVVTIWGNFILSIKNKNEIIFFKKKIIKNKKEYANWEEKKKVGCCVGFKFRIYYYSRRVSTSFSKNSLIILNYRIGPTKDIYLNIPPFKSPLFFSGYYTTSFNVSKNNNKIKIKTYFFQQHPKKSRTYIPNVAHRLIWGLLKV